ncbi:hypothetical protein [Rhizobacter sp. P5_C2]
MTARPWGRLRGRPWGQGAAIATAVLVPMALAAFAGLVIAVESPQLTLMVVGAIGGLALLFVPTWAIVYGMFGLAFFGVGLLMYYGHILQAHWLPYALALFLWLKLPIDALARSIRPSAPTPVQPLTWCLLALFALTLLSVAFNETPFLYALVGARNYFFVWSTAFAIAAGAMTERQLLVCFRLALGIAALQLPFAVQQHFMNFASGASWDSVVGTYGGDPEGGGASGTLALFGAYGMGLAIALWTHGALGGRLAAAVVLSSVASLMFAEVKAFFVFAPLMLGVVLFPELRRRPALVTGVLLVTTALLAGTFTYYRLVYYKPVASARVDSGAGDYLAYAVGADIKLSHNINRVTGEVSRVGAPLIWVQEGGFGPPHGRWVGYGPRASRASAMLGKGEAAKHFVFALTTSTLTVALWDLGLLGLSVILGLLVVALLSAWRLSRDERIPAAHRGALQATAGLFLLALASLPYNDTVVDSHSMQFFYAFSVGYLMFWQRRLAALPRA